MSARSRPTELWRTLIRRLRWQVAAPILRPILREWQIEWIARSEMAHVHAMEIEQAFGCTSFDDRKHYVRHYS